MDKKSVLQKVNTKHPVSPVPLKCEDWPEGLFVARLTGKEVDTWKDRLANDQMGVNTTSAYWVAICLLDEKHERLFNPDDPADVDLLLTEIAYAPLQEAAHQCMLVNGLNEEARDDATKNSEKTGD